MDRWSQWLKACCSWGTRWNELGLGGEWSETGMDDNEHVDGGVGHCSPPSMAGLPFFIPPCS